MGDINIINQFITAAGNGNENIVLYFLLTSQVNINDKDCNGTTALMCAAINNNESMVSLLFDKGADINIKNNDGYTALMLAVRNNYESIVSLLIDKGADINMKNNVSILSYNNYYDKMSFNVNLKVYKLMNSIINHIY